jgi:peptidoglycan/xylan/chitin deacetylase (PgdA/CDA1 family)
LFKQNLAQILKPISGDILMKKIIKYTLNILLKFTGIMKYKYSSSHILAFHRVVKPSKLSEFGLRNYEITENRLIEIIELYISKGFQFVTINNFIKNISNEKIKQVAFTFDDGYSDIIDNVLPIIKRYKIPITVYFVPNYLNSSHLKWDYITESIVSNSTQIDKIFNFLGIHNEDSSQKFEKARAYDLIKNRLKCLNNQSDFHIINNFIENFGQKHIKHTQEILLNEDQLRYLSKENLVTIGSHSMNHYVMGELSDSELETELVNSKYALEKITKNTVQHFSFPYGDCGSREIKAAKKAGYISATTTIGRNIYKHKKENSFFLPRYVVKIGTPNDTYLSIMNGFKGL